MSGAEDVTGERWLTRRSIYDSMVQCGMIGDREAPHTATAMDVGDDNNDDDERSAQHDSTRALFEDTWAPEAVT